MDKIKAVESSDGNIHLLFIDDDPNLLDASRRLLERLGYIVTTAYNGNEAIDILKDCHDVFDVVITDYDMPGMNGVELALAAREFLLDTPVILFSGKIDLKDETIIWKAGMAAIVKKPCRIKELDNIIRGVINADNVVPMVKETPEYMKLRGQVKV